MPKRKKVDERVDEAERESFPASDPPAHTVVTGARVKANKTKAASDAPAVRDNRRRNRFELEIEGHVAFLDYNRAPGVIRLLHTEVPPPLQGRGLATQLIKHALETAKKEKREVESYCSSVDAYLEKHGMG